MDIRFCKSFISAAVVIGSLTGAFPSSGMGPDVCDVYETSSSPSYYASGTRDNSRAHADSDDRNLTETERALLLALRSVLSSPEIRRVSLDEIRRQIQFNPPVAFMDGYWVTPIDLTRVIAVPLVNTEMRRIVSADSAVIAVLEKPETARQLVALTFTSRALAAEMKLPFVGRFLQLARPDSEGVFVVPVKDSEWAVNEYLPPGVSEGEPECYYFCGDPDEWDFDSDGVLNHADTDDDNDSVPDSDDPFPYYPVETDGPPESTAFIGFTEKFSSGVVRTLMAAHDNLRSSDLLTLGVVADGSPVRMGFPEITRPTTDPCEERDLSAVRFVSRDVLDCARIRFSCKAGETGFSDECGCGCINAD